MTVSNKPIVSSAHLASGGFSEISELEFALIIAGNAFQRWMVRAMAAAGFPDMSPLDVLVLHTVRHRDRPKKLADICVALNIEDTHNVSYAIKKLSKAGLVAEGKSGKEKTVEATKRGADACETYRGVREHLLLNSLNDMGFDPDMVSRLSTLLRQVSGQYDQAARGAAVL